MTTVLTRGERESTPNVHDPSHPCMSGQRHGSGPKTSFIYIILPRSPVFDDSLHADEITPFNYYWTETNVYQQSSRFQMRTHEKDMCLDVECRLVFQISFRQRKKLVKRYVIILKG
jgi:hypothetical protein